MGKHNAATAEGVHVMAQRCETCIFKPGNLMRLGAGRVKEMVTEATGNDSAIICHKTLDTEQNAVCRGFFDRFPTQPLQVAQRLEMVIWHG